MNSRFFTLGCVAALVSSCVGDLTIPADAKLTCRTAADCPADLVCNVDAALCVAPGTVLDLAAPIVVRTAVDVARIGAGDTAILTVTANEAIETATVVDNDGHALAVTIADDVVTVEIAGAGRDRSGAVTITLEWADAAGNSAVATITSGVVIDIDPPLAQADTVAVVANGNANVLSPAAPLAARADSGAVVVFGFDEVVVAATGPRLVPFSDPEDVGFDLDAVAVDVDVTINAAGTGVIVSIAPGGLVAVDEGAWLVGLDVQDDLGNVGRVVSATPLVVDTTPPPPPTLAVVRRAPFGDGARVSASNALAGTALDAVLVLAIPASVVVDNSTAPQFVGRREPDAVGAFAIEVPVDIEALRVVAVDEAGNLSLPASPLVVELVASILASTTPHRIFARQSSEDVLVQRADSAIGDRLRTGAVTTTAAPVWTPLTTVAQVGIGSAPALAFDPASGGTLAVIRGETFMLRGNQFTRLAVPRLPVEEGYSLATDLRRGVVVLFGGEGADDEARNGLWEFNGEAWTERLVHDKDALDRPSPRVGAGAVYSAALGGVAVVNGCGKSRFEFIGRFCGTSLPPDVWLWDGATFANLCTGAACGEAPKASSPEVTVDARGALVATGGFNGLGAESSAQPLPSQVFVFDGARWQGRCAGSCGEALPANAAAYFDAASQTPAFFGRCNEGPCTARLADDDTITVTILQGSTPDLGIGGPTFDQRPVLAEPDGRLVVAMFGTLGNLLGFVAAVEGERIGVVVPAQITPRCGGAVVDLDGDAAVVGGCESCGLVGAGAADACVVPSAVIEVPGHARVARGISAASGLLRRVDALAGPRLVHSLSDPDAGTAHIFDALDLAAAPTVVTLGSQRSVEGAFPLSDGRIALLESTLDPFGVTVLLDTVRAVDGSAVQTVCAGSCGGVGGGIFGLAVAGDVSAGSTVFGGDAGAVVVGDGTVRFSSAGVVVDGVTSASPPARRFGSATFEEATAATWLFGGTSAPDRFTGNDIFDCGVPGGTSTCGDLWRLTGTDWQQVDTVDVAGFGRPLGRYSAAFGAVGGRLILAGGEGRRAQALDDAWALDVSPSRVPSHLVEVSLTPYGTDAAGTVSAVDIEWCGEAKDASGQSTAMQGRVWIGGGWRAAALVVEAGCARGHLDVSDVADVVIRNNRIFVEVRATGVSATGSAVPTLTTTQLTVTAVFRP